MAKKFVKATGLHNLFDVSGSTLDTSTLKSGLEATANENSIIYITADASDATYAYDSGDTYIWTKGVLYGRNKKVIESTWDALNTLKTNSLLIPGQLYRITDYATSTSTTDTQSAGHDFDIIIAANSVNTFDEEAKAVLHSGDTYFADSKLDAWDIRYCFDNDTDRFAWASSSGKGVIYYMKDEWNNEAPYDFKNIQFNGEFGSVRGYVYIFSNNVNNIISDGSISGKFVNNVVKPKFDSTNKRILSGGVAFSDSSTYISNRYVGCTWSAFDYIV